jgi:hypothetical protein
MLKVSTSCRYKGAFFALAACVLMLLTAPGAAVAGTDPTDPKHPKPSSFAPHPTTKRAFGAPIQKPILHKRKKPKPPAAPAPAEPIK